MQNNSHRVYKDDQRVIPSKRKEQPRKFFNQESDDEDQPPALSNYALALLEKEQRENATRSLRQVPKRVNFTNSNPVSPRPVSSEINHTNNTNNHSVHTNHSEYETIFTKDVNEELNSYASISSANSAHEKTPNGHGKLLSQNTVTSNPRTGSSVRRVRGFGSLGPPKRASYVSPPSLSLPSETPVEQDVKPTTATVTPVKSPRTPKIFDFEGLNPYQYCSKYNLPSSDLPRYVKLYIQQQKLEAKESLNSPIRLKEVLHKQIEEQMRQEASKPKIEVYQQDSKNSTYDDHSNRENVRQRYEAINSVERPSKRQPLAPLNENRQDQLQNMMKPAGYRTTKPEQASEPQEHYYKETEPLKAPDYSSKVTSRLITVNGKQYEKLELLGKGGSSKVFKVKSLNNKVYAIKKILFDEFDDSSISGFKGEIALLSKLRDQKRVVTLIDYSLAQGSLMLVMECGDVDLSHVLTKRLDMPFDVEFVRFHSNEILKCVQAVHDAGIVHSDLKPANFLFVKGILKIIDFGIANAVPEHTVNIYRESQIGTPNYMAPEALIDNNQYIGSDSSDIKKSTWKVGKPSDIWSCGCIIYQMIYGRPPYGGYQGSQRLLAIMNPNIKIAYPEKGLGGVKVPGTAIDTIKACLVRDPSLRWTAQEVLDGPFLKPRVVSEQFVNDLVKNAITYGVSKTSIDDDELKALADDVWRRVSQLSL